jgi:hypothetical protein
MSNLQVLRVDEEMEGALKYLLSTTQRRRHHSHMYTHIEIIYTAPGSATDLSKIYVVTFCDSMAGITNDFTFYAGV